MSSEFDRKSFFGFYERERRNEQYAKTASNILKSLNYPSFMVQRGRAVYDSECILKPGQLRSARAIDSK